jgi:predicted protein tyrosine phosphatase
MQIKITSRMAIWSLADDTNNKWTRQSDSQLLNNDFDTKWVLISIVGKDEDHLTDSQIKILKSKGLKDILQLRFDDLDGEIFEKILAKYKARGDDIDREKFIWFNDDHAESIIEFAERHRNDQGNVIIHCHAGVSRSSGIGCALAEMYGIPAATIFNDHPNIQPNKHVLRIIYKQAGRNFNDYVEWYNQIEHPEYPIDSIF